jgi:hypothetical protein
LGVGRRLLQHEVESLELVFQPLVFFLFGRFALRSRLLGGIFLVRGVVILRLSVIFELFLVGAALHLGLGGFHLPRD